MNAQQYQLSKRQEKRARRREAAGLVAKQVIPAGPRIARSDGKPLQAYRNDQLSNGYRRDRAAQVADAASAVQARRDLVGGLAIALLPAMLLVHFLWTVTDYARVELTLRGDSHEPSVVMTYLRTVAYVLKRPITLLHAGIGWIAFALITVGYMYLSAGHPMYGAEGAVTLFEIRQGVALARTAIRVGVMARQIELGKTRALPLRHVEAKTDAKKS